MALFGITNLPPAPFCASFIGVLSIPEHRSFYQSREQMVWIGPDAALEWCAAIDFANRKYTRPKPAPLIAKLPAVDVRSLTYQLIISLDELRFFVFCHDQPPAVLPIPDRLHGRQPKYRRAVGLSQIWKFLGNVSTPAPATVKASVHVPIMSDVRFNHG